MIPDSWADRDADWAASVFNLDIFQPGIFLGARKYKSRFRLK